MFRIVQVPILVVCLAVSLTLLCSTEAASGCDASANARKASRDLPQAAAAEECKDITSYECHKWAVEVAQSQLEGKFPNLVVHVEGEIIVFADPQAFGKLEGQTGLRDEVRTSGLEVKLCRIGYRKMRLEPWGANPKRPVAQEYELRCPKAGDASQSSATSGSYSMSPFDTSADKLPSNYHGHDPEVVYERLSQGRKKSEYESTAEYGQRLTQMAAKPIIGSLTLGSVFAFSVRHDEIRSHYDADSKNLSVSIRLWSVSKEREVPQQCSERIKSVGLCRSITEHYVGGHALWLTTKMFNRGDYLGTNAYGVTTTVESRLRNEYKLEFTNLDEFPTRKWGDWAVGDDKELFAVFPMTPTQAQAAKSSLQVVALCNLHEPYVTSDSGSHTPTVEEPYDWITIFDHLHGQLLELWFYDASTGIVHARFKPAKGRVSMSQP